MKIAICEDEGAATKRLSDIIRAWEKEKGVFAEIFPYINAEKFLDDWNENEDYDIIFLDIKMDKMDGMDLARRIRRTNLDVAIVFVTNIKEFVTAMESYEVTAMRFLDKPVKKEKVFLCLDKVNQNGKNKKYFLFDDPEKKFRIAHEDIIYIKKSSNNANIVTAIGTYSLRRTVAQLLEELDDELFIQSHKSYIINIRRIKFLYNDQIIMSNGVRLPLSKSFVIEAQKRFVDYSIRKDREK